MVYIPTPRGKIPPASPAPAPSADDIILSLRGELATEERIRLAISLWLRFPRWKAALPLASTRGVLPAMQYIKHLGLYDAYGKSSFRTHPWCFCLSCLTPTKGRFERPIMRVCQHCPPEYVIPVTFPNLQDLWSNIAPFSTESWQIFHQEVTRYEHKQIALP